MVRDRREVIETTGRRFDDDPLALANDGFQRFG
jgi:hypothetical protein